MTLHPLTEARKRAKLSQQALADAVECDRQSILRIENGRQRPSPEMVEKIIAVLIENNVELSAGALRPDLAATFAPKQASAA